MWIVGSSRPRKLGHRLLHAVFSTCFWYMFNHLSAFKPLLKCSKQLLRSCAHQVRRGAFKT